MLLRGVGGRGGGGLVDSDFGGGDEEGGVGVFAFGGGGVVAEDVVGEEPHVVLNFSVIYIFGVGSILGAGHAVK